MNLLYFIVFLTSALIASIVILKTLAVAYKYSLFDTINERKIHKGRIPRLGGVAIYLASLVTIVLFWMIVKLTGVVDSATLLCGANHLLLVFCGVTLLFGVGLYDDLKGVRYRNKFFAQIVAGLLLCFSGVWLSDLYGLFGLNSMLPEWSGFMLTVFAILLITNAINFIDGIDGLASGLCTICLLTYFVVSVIVGAYWYAFVCAALLGSIASFMAFNIKGKPENKKKLFMGDTGSLVLSFMIGYIGIALNTNPILINSCLNPFVVVFSPLLLPCFDVVRVVGVRLYQRRSPFLADKSHIHHMLLEINDDNQTKTLVQMIAISLFLTLASVCFSFFLNINLVFYLDVLLWLLIMMIISRKIKQIHKSNENQTIS